MKHITLIASILALSVHADNFDNIGIGYSMFDGSSLCNNNIVFGDYVGVDGGDISRNIILGNSSFRNAHNVVGNIAIGNLTGICLSNCYDSVFIGSTVGSYGRALPESVDIQNQIFVTKTGNAFYINPQKKQYLVDMPFYCERDVIHLNTQTDFSKAFVLYDGERFDVNYSGVAAEKTYPSIYANNYKLNEKGTAYIYLDPPEYQDGKDGCGYYGKLRVSNVKIVGEKKQDGSIAPLHMTADLFVHIQEAESYGYNNSEVRIMGVAESRSSMYHDFKTGETSYSSCFVKGTNYIGKTYYYYHVPGFVQSDIEKMATSFSVTHAGSSINISTTYNIALASDHSGGLKALYNGSVSIPFPTTVSSTYKAYVPANISEVISPSLTNDTHSLATGAAVHDALGGLRIVYDEETDTVKLCKPDGAVVRTL